MRAEMARSVGMSVRCETARLASGLTLRTASYSTMREVELKGSGSCAALTLLPFRSRCNHLLARLTTRQPLQQTLSTSTILAETMADQDGRPAKRKRYVWPKPFLSLARVLTCRCKMHEQDHTNQAWRRRRCYRCPRRSFARAFALLPCGT